MTARSTPRPYAAVSSGIVSPAVTGLFRQPRMRSHPVMTSPTAITTAIAVITSCRPATWAEAGALVAGPSKPPAPEDTRTAHKLPSRATPTRFPTMRV